MLNFIFLQKKYLFLIIFFNYVHINKIFIFYLIFFYLHKRTQALNRLSNKMYNYSNNKKHALTDSRNF